MSDKRYLAVRLPMYDWSEVRFETRQLEAALQAEIIDALALDPQAVVPWPEAKDLVEGWTSPDLLLAQTCGYPLTHALQGKVRLVGAPHYAAKGCDGPRYCSQIVVRRDSDFRQLEDLRGAVATYNGDDSQSGMNAFRRSLATVAKHNSFFSKVVVSGGHLKSMQAVAEGTADVASIDAVCWHLACNELPDLSSKLRVIEETMSAPGLPFITSTRMTKEEANLIARAVDRVLGMPETQKSRERLGIRGFSKLSDQAYKEILLMEQEAFDLGYPTLT
ncbi:PhnD/SsuA/transferrin family substrate-binding protein [Roseibium sp.]|uniref:phosphate/phosphite/phosphonate ABC transporter substrate-binding protein n=1 Tax=Roseibium sp. TaxID=1936156 RepID=UPI0025D6C8A6|nr:PhnD/SsuA/transferrin family substrate-binding protein [Roseibium sp.]